MPWRRPAISIVLSLLTLPASVIPSFRCASAIYALSRVERSDSFVRGFGGRPSGLPDRPFLKRWASGGLQYPTLWRPSPSLSSAIAGLIDKPRRQNVIGRDSKFLPGSLQFC